MSLQQGRHTLIVEMQALEHDLLEMGSRAEAMVSLAVDALCRLDTETALLVLERDDDIDQRELDIENRCIRLLALQQPMATDLREVGTALKMITDIERVGDLSVDIAKIAMKIGNESGQSDFIDLRSMANLAKKMLHDALESFVRRDLDLVRQVISQDDQVDALYRELRGQIHETLRRDPEHVVASSWMLLAIHHVERIADHSVNIAERVSFMVTGRMEQLAVSHRSDMPDA
jgi:phosphate transport system protein